MWWIKSIEFLIAMVMVLFFSLFHFVSLSLTMVVYHFCAPPPPFIVFPTLHDISRPPRVPVRLPPPVLQAEYPPPPPPQAAVSTASSPLHRSKCSADRLLLVREVCRCSSPVCSSPV